MRVVDQKGLGDHTTIQAALDSAKAGETIHISSGVYHEKLLVIKDGITLVGESAGSTIIQYGDYAKQLLPDGSEKNTFLSYTMLVAASDVTLLGLTIENTAGDGRNVGQAVALYAAGDRLTVRDCQLIAHQDTLFLGPTFPKVAMDALNYPVPVQNGSATDDQPPDYRQYYENCIVIGDVDFIFGPYRAWFEGCTLLMRNRGLACNGYYTAASTPEGQPYGFVFHRCSLSGLDCPPSTALLGRPWRPYAKTAFLDCHMEDCVAPVGFSDWGEKPVTGGYQEYGSFGAGAGVAKRHKGAMQLSREQAKRITLSEVLGGWKPKDECSEKTRGVSSGAVMAFLDHLEQKGVDMHGFVILRDGQLCHEGYWQPFSGDEPHRMYSVSKTMTGLAIGILQGDGLLSVNDSICEHFPEFVSECTPPQVRRTTILDMLSMQTPYNGSAYQKDRPDWTRPFFEGKAEHESGSVFHYDTSASQVLCALVEKLTGSSILDFLQKRLFEPLGLAGEKRWLKDGMGVSQGGTGLLMTLRDLAAVADCLMMDGMGLIPADYIRDMTRIHALTELCAWPNERLGYGLQLWCGQMGAAVLYGMGGQLAVCLPRQRMVVATTADTRLCPAMLGEIYNAIYDVLLERLTVHEQNAELAQRLSSLTLAPVWHQPIYGEWPTCAYRVQPNGAGFQTIRLTKDALLLTDASGEHRLPFLLGGLAKGVLPATQEPCLTSGGLLAENRFLLHIRLIGDTICGLYLLFSFEGDKLTVTPREVGDAATARFRETLLCNAIEGFDK